MVEVKNQLDNAVYQAEKMKTEYKDKLSEEDSKTLQEAIDEAKTHLEATDKDELEKAAKDLSDKIMPIGAKMYEAASKDAESPVDSQQSDSQEKDKDKKKKKDEPVEGEVVDDKKDSD